MFMRHGNHFVLQPGGCVKNLLYIFGFGKFLFLPPGILEEQKTNVKKPQYQWICCKQFFKDHVVIGKRVEGLHFLGNEMNTRSVAKVLEYPFSFHPPCAQHIFPSKFGNGV